MIKVLKAFSKEAFKRVTDIDVGEFKNIITRDKNNK